MDYYSTLGVSRNATPDEIRKAYKKQSMQHHPDRGGNEEQFKKVNEAYSTLKDPQKRAAYDNPQPRFNSGQFNNQGFGFEDIFSEMFRNNPRQRPQVKNPDINLAVSIDIPDLYTGKNVYVTYSLRSGTQEKVEINIPKGISDGQVIRYKGLGDNSIKELPRGDLYVKIKVRNNKQWHREGYDLHGEKLVNVLDLVLGTEISIDTPDGKGLLLKIPKGTNPDTIFSIHGYGIPDIKRGRQGILYIRIKGITPKVVDNKILKRLEKLRNGIS